MISIHTKRDFSALTSPTIRLTNGIEVSLGESGNEINMDLAAWKSLISALEILDAMDIKGRRK